MKSVDDDDEEKLSETTVENPPKNQTSFSSSSPSITTPPVSSPPQSLLQIQISRQDLSSEFPYLSRYDTQDLVLQILSYLNAKDLCSLARTSRSFYYSTMTPKLWKNLLLLDFMFDENETRRINEIPNTLPIFQQHQKNQQQQYRKRVLVEEEKSDTQNLKNYYTRQYQEVQIRIQSAKNIKLQMEREQKLERRVQWIESFLDITSIRIYLPLPFASIFSTLLMIGLRVDGDSLPIWVCLSPLLFFFVYTFFVSLIAYITYGYRHHPSSLIRSLWTNLRGPIQTFYTQVIQESKAAARVSLLACLLCLFQIVMFGLKTSRSIGQPFHEKFDWGIVFLPLWLLFCLYLCIPFLECARGNLGPFFVTLGLLWIPLFILFVVLTVKLNGSDDGTHDRKIKLSLILIPFWILEGIIMTAGLVGLINGIHRYRKGFLDRENFLERVGMMNEIISLST
jgi:hypothetical protein